MQPETTCHRLVSGPDQAVVSGGRSVCGVRSVSQGVTRYDGSMDSLGVHSLKLEVGLNAMVV